MDANTSVTGDSNFKHFANALRKREQHECAAYVEGLAHGAHFGFLLNARDCWARASSARMMREMLLFLRGVVDDFPESCKRALYAAECGAGPARLKSECPDPFAACEDSVTLMVELTREELRFLKDVVGAKPPDEGPAQAIYDHFKSLLEAK